MTDKRLPTYKIVVGYDFSEQASLALAHALTMAKHRPRTVLHVVTVFDFKNGKRQLPGQTPDFAKVEKALEDLTREVQAAVEAHQPEGLTYFVHARTGAPAREILSLAREADADSIVVGTHGRKGVRRLILGSVAEKLVRYAGCPVIVVREKAYEESVATAELELALEPPCPDCADHRQKTGGAEWWCEKHSHAHSRARMHRYTYRSRVALLRSEENPIY